MWSQNYREAKQYYNIHGFLPTLKTANDEDKKCVHWLLNQRKKFQSGMLSEKQLKQLAEIGVTEEWLAPRLTPFEKGYKVAKAHYEEYGNLNIATNFQHKSGFWLGAWADKIRKKRNELTKEQIKRLDAIGFVWEQESSDHFEERFAIAKEYYDKHGELPLEPKQCKTEDELRICQWLRRQLIKKNEGKLDQERIERLRNIGMDFLNSLERSWKRGYSHAEAYRTEFGNLDVIVSYVATDGYPLGEWLHTQRTHKKQLSTDKRLLLQKIGAKGI